MNDIAAELKRNIAQNIAKLRQAAGMTQAELAESLNYTDKAISKWERAESIPDVIILKNVAMLFGVTVDYLLEEHDGAAAVQEPPRRRISNRAIITMLSTISVWFIATVLYVIGRLSWTVGDMWMVYVIAVPVSLIVLLVFSGIWGNRKLTCLIVSALVWSLLALIYLLFREQNYWLVFVLGIPAQIIVLLSFGIKLR